MACAIISIFTFASLGSPATMTFALSGYVPFKKLTVNTGDGFPIGHVGEVDSCLDHK